MAKDDRDILETLKDELVFIEKGAVEAKQARRKWR